MVNAPYKLALTLRIVNRSVAAVAWTEPDTEFSACQEKRGQQSGALRHGARQDMFARRVSTIAHGAEPVQCGNSQRCGEIAVGASARGSFADMQPHLLAQLSRSLVEPGAMLAFEGSAAETTPNFQPGARQNRPQGMESLLNFTHVGSPQSTQI